MACRQLGWTHIPIQWVDELSEDELKAIEYEENAKRTDLPWQDKMKAIRGYHDIKLKSDSEWTQDQTAEALGYERPTIGAYFQISREVDAGNLELLSHPKLSTARGIVERKIERAAAADDERFSEITRDAFAGRSLAKSDETILHEDFLKWAPSYEGPRVNFLHCDFPYGIGADTFNQGAAPAHGGYDDTLETNRRLVSCLLTHLDRFCADSAHLLFWFSMENYCETLQLLRTRFDVAAIPLVWFKSDNSGILPDPNRGPRRVYETAFLGSRGDCKIVRAVSNLFAAESVKDAHMSEKPVEMLHYFFGMIVDQYTTMLDPTCGSGSALRAAERLNAKSVLGLEINKEFVDRARLKLRQARVANNA
jgi:hypothetical protein